MRHFITAVLASLPIFSGVGCGVFKTAGQQALEGAIGYVNETVIPDLEEKAKEIGASALDSAKAYADRKIQEKEEAEKAAINATLATLAKPDPDTGVVQPRTWRDFDADNDGALNPAELFKIEAFVLKNAMGREDFGTIAKSTTASVGTLALLWGGSKLVRRRRNGKREPPPDPTQPVTTPSGAPNG